MSDKKLRYNRKSYASTPSIDIRPFASTTHCGTLLLECWALCCMSIAKKPPLRLTSLVECLVLFLEGIGFYRCWSILLWSQSRPTRMKRLCTRHTSMAHVWCPWEGNVSWIDGSSVRWGYRPIARTYRQFESCVRMLWSPSVHPLLRSPASLKATTIYVMKTRSLLHENPDALSWHRKQSY